MNVERTIEFLLKNQARMDAKFAKADARFARADNRMDRIERVVAQNNRITTRLERYGSETESKKLTASGPSSLLRLLGQS
jgi:hypothetical protein